MKIAYIGISDGLADPLIKKLGQEGNDVYILSDKAFSKKLDSIFQYRFYRIPRNGDSFEQLLRSIVPECIIFAGNHYMNSSFDEKYHNDMVLLAQSLRVASDFENVKFILLSSTDVYGHTDNKAGELQEQAPATQRGIHFTQEEQLIDIYRKQFGLNSVVLRVSQLYANRAWEGGDDFLSRNITDAISLGGGGIQDFVFQPLHVSDLVSAIQKVMDFGKQYIYNVCGSTEISASSIYQLIAQREQLDGQDMKWKEPGDVTLADDSLIRQELEWCDTKNLADQITNGEITYERAVKTEGQKNKRNVIPVGIRHLLENLLIFAFFFLLNNFFASNSLFANINFMRIYVVLIAIAYGVRQSHLAGVLASAAYLYMHGMGDLGMNNFFSYASSILIIVEFVFTSLIISYTIDALKEQVRDLRVNLNSVKEEYDDLNTINKENVLIKNEYELRILSSDSGLSKLYNMINRLTNQGSDNIAIEIMKIISETVRTDTVAVYSVDFESNCLRLVDAMSDASAVYGEDWNLSESEHIFEVVMRAEFYQGEPDSSEPAVVIPVICHDIHEAVIIIKSIPYECETLYHVNLLKTMALLLEDSLEKALDYYEQTLEKEKAKMLEMQKHSEKSSGILEPYEFCDRLLQAEAQAAEGLGQYCLVELEYSGNIEEVGNRIGNTFESMGCLGFDDTGKLFALLNSAGAQDMEFVQDFFAIYGMKIARIVEDEQPMETEGTNEIEMQEPGEAGSCILEPYDFCDRLLEAEAQAVEGLGQYCLVELEYSGNFEDLGKRIGNTFESMGCLGFDDTGKLFALLNSAGAEDMEFVRDFFAIYGMKIARVIEDEQPVETEETNEIEMQEPSEAASCILEPYEFCDRLLEAEVQAAEGLGQHCLIELEYSGNIEDVGKRIGNTFESMGCLGFDDTGKLFALLNSAGAQDMEFVQDFFAIYGMKIARVVTDEQPMETEETEEIEMQEPSEAGSCILESFEFGDRLLEAQAQAAEGLGQYCLVELEYSGNIEDVGKRIGDTFESMGCLGFDDTGKLFALLNNVGAQDMEFVRDFFAIYGVKVVRTGTGEMM